MLEIVFSESAAGGLKIAQGFGRGKRVGGATSVILKHADGTPASRQEIRRARKEEEERLQRRWESAVPLGGTAGDICSFHLGLSMGDIRESGIAPARLQTLRRLFGCYPAKDIHDAASEIIHTAQDSLRRLLERAAAGEPLRIWYSYQPDELCGLCWLMAQLPPTCPGSISLIKLPVWESLDDRRAAFHTNGWGEICPEDFSRYLPLQQTASALFCQSCAQHWRRLQNENSPLRACVNGRLISVAETFYDDIIRRAIARQDEVFHEARLIGQILGAEPLGLSDGWLFLRIESMIAAGELIPETQPAAGEPLYHRMLRKASS